LDWLLKMEEDNISYDELKMLAQDRIQDGVSEDENLPYGQNTTAAIKLTYTLQAYTNSVYMQKV